MPIKSICRIVFLILLFFTALKRVARKSSDNLLTLVLTLSGVFCLSHQMCINPMLNNSFTLDIYTTFMRSFKFTRFY